MIAKPEITKWEDTTMCVTKWKGPTAIYDYSNLCTCMYMYCMFHIYIYCVCMCARKFKESSVSTGFRHL